MAKKDIIDKIAQKTSDAAAYNPLMTSLRENDKRNLFNPSASSFFHKTGFPMFDYYFGSVINLHDETGAITSQEPRVGQAAGTFNMIVGNTGSGKALPDSTVIPTPDGGRRLDTLRIGDKVFGSDGKPCNVIGVYPQGVKEVWAVECDHDRVAKCSFDHLWAYHYRQYGKLVECVDTTGSMIKLMSGSNCKTLMLPKVNPVQFDQQAVPVHPYLFGRCLVDNDFMDTCLRVMSKDADASTFPAVRGNRKLSLRDFDEVYEVLRSVTEDPDDKTWAEPTGWALIDIIMRHDFGSPVPAAYRNNTEEVRWQLLRGIIDGCGKIKFVDTRYRRRTVVTLASIDRWLLSDIRSILRSLGMEADLSDKLDRRSKKYLLRIINDIGNEFIQCHTIPSKLTKSIELTASYNNAQSSCYDDKSNKLTAITVNKIYPCGEEEMTCIKVDREDGLFFTEDYLITHNTTLTVQMASNIIRPFRNASIMHYDFEERFDISRAENITRLPIKDFDDGGRYVLQQGMLSLDATQEALVKLYAEKIRNKDQLVIGTGKLNEFGKEIFILPPTIVILDSVANIVPDSFSVDNAKELASAEALRGNMAGARDAKTMRGFLRDITPLLKSANIIIYAINHINSAVNINIYAGPTKQMNFLKPEESIPGGKALFFSSYNLPKLTSKPSDDFTEATDGFNGHMVMVEPIKSSSNQSGNNNKGVSFDLVFSYKHGFDSLRSLIMYGKEKGIIDGTKPRLKFVDDPSFTFAWKELDTEKEIKPIWDCVKKYIMPELNAHLSFVEPVNFDERSLEY